MPHDHHHHPEIDAGVGDARVAWAVAVNVGLTLAQVVGGILSGSLALIADALHNFSDAVSLIIAFVARKIARRPATADMSFGFGRAEIVAALVNYTTLIMIALYLVYEGIMRFFDPNPINGWLVVWIAVIALVVDMVTAALTYRMARDSMNIRAAFLHNMADALGSVAVIIAGVCVILFDWIWVDPIMTLLIAGYILWHVRTEIGPVIRALMLASPAGMDVEDVAIALEALDGVSDVHHLHLWVMQEHHATLDAHLVIDEGAWVRADAIKQAGKKVLSERFGIMHSTLELECARHACTEPDRIGHG